MRRRLHGDCEERRKLHGVRGGDVQECYRLCGVLSVPRGQVCGDDRLCCLLNVPVRLKRGCDWERGGHVVHLFGGTHGE